MSDHDPECDCYRCKLRSVQFGPVITPSPQTLMERRWDKDMPAYARLRRDGLQPRGIDGSARLEATASSQMEIELGHLIAPEHYQQVIETNEAVQQTGWEPKDSVDDMKDKYLR
jgi:hypothetical protein